PDRRQHPRVVDPGVPGRPHEILRACHAATLPGGLRAQPGAARTRTGEGVCSATEPPPTGEPGAAGDGKGGVAMGTAAGPPTLREDGRRRRRLGVAVLIGVLIVLLCCAGAVAATVVAPDTDDREGSRT